MGRLKFDFHTGLHLGVAAEGEGVGLAEFLGRRAVRRAARRAQRVLLPVEAPGYIFSNTKFAEDVAARQRHGALAQVLTDRAREVRGVVLVAEEVLFVDAHRGDDRAAALAIAVLRWRRSRVLRRRPSSVLTTRRSSRGVKTAS